MYSNRSKDYKVWVTKDEKFVVSRDLKFHEESSVNDVNIVEVEAENHKNDSDNSSAMDMA